MLACGSTRRGVAFFFARRSSRRMRAVIPTPRSVEAEAKRPSDLPTPAPPPGFAVREKEMPTAVVFAYEFADPIFSGNGTCGRSLVAAVSRCPLFRSEMPASCIYVVTAVPVPPTLLVTCVPSGDSFFSLWGAASLCAAELQHAMTPRLFPPSSPAEAPVLLLPVLVPEAKWRRLDTASAFEEYARGSAALLDAARRVTDTASIVDPCWAPVSTAWANVVTVLRRAWSGSTDTHDEVDAMVFYVDWIGSAAALACGQALFGPPFRTTHPRGRSFYLNFRVFSAAGAAAESDQAFFAEREAEAVLAADVTFALCRADAACLRALSTGRSLSVARRCRIDVLLPPVRNRVLHLGEQYWSTGARGDRSGNPRMNGTIVPPSVPVAAAAGGRVGSRRRTVLPLPQCVVEQLNGIAARHPAWAAAIDDCIISPPTASCTVFDGPSGGSVSGDDVSPDGSRSIAFVVSAVRLDAPKRAAYFIELVSQWLRRHRRRRRHGGGSTTAEEGEQEPSQLHFAATAATACGRHQQHRPPPLNGVLWLVPLLCGAAAEATYAAQVKAQLRKETGGDCVIVDEFLSPDELAAIFQRTAINVHPCLYDAYGLTVVEAGIFGTPSLVHHTTIPDAPSNGRSRLLTAAVAAVPREAAIVADDRTGVPSVGVTDLLRPSEFIAWDLREAPDAESGVVARLDDIVGNAVCCITARHVVDEDEVDSTVSPATCDRHVPPAAGDGAQEEESDLPEWEQIRRSVRRRAASHTEDVCGQELLIAAARGPS